MHCEIKIYKNGIFSLNLKDFRFRCCGRLNGLRDRYRMSAYIVYKRCVCSLLTLNTLTSRHLPIRCNQQYTKKLKLSVDIYRERAESPPKKRSESAEWNLIVWTRVNQWLCGYYWLARLSVMQSCGETTHSKITRASLDVLLRGSSHWWLSSSLG